LCSTEPRKAQALTGSRCYVDAIADHGSITVWRATGTAFLSEARSDGKLPTWKYLSDISEMC